MQDNPMLQTFDLTHRYGRRVVLDHLDLSLNKGEVFGIIGANGAGKSTFLSIVTTLLKPSHGDIAFNGTSIIRHPEIIRSGMGFVPQELALYPTLTARQNLFFWGGVYGIPKKERYDTVTRVLSQISLLDRENDRIETWSGGMKRRLNIAAAVMHKPAFLVMDEPTAGIDVFSKKMIASMIQQFRSEGKTVLLTSHDMDHIQVICDRIGILQHQHIIAEGSVPEVLAKTQSDSLENLLFSLEDHV